MLGKHHYAGSDYGKPGRLRGKLMNRKERWAADNILPEIFSLIEQEKDYNCGQYIIHRYKRDGKMKSVRLVIRSKK